MSATTNAGQILEQQLLEAQILHRVNAATSDDPRRVLEIICTEIAKTLNADSVAFGRLSDAGDSLEIIAEYCQNQNAALSTFLPLTEGQITFHTLRERRAVVMDAQNNPDFAVHRKTLEKLGIKNMMIVPIVEHQAIFGALSVDSFIAKNFSIADQQFAMNAVQAAMPALKQMQIIEALRQSQNRFIHLVNKLECIVSEGEIVDGQIHLSFVSQYAQTIMGYSVQEWYQNPKWFEMAIYKPDLESVCGQLQKAIHSLEPIDFEYRVQHKNGGLVWLRNQLSFEVQNNRVFWRSLATDISQAKKQQQLDQERNHILEMIAQGAALTDTLQTIVGLLYRQFGLPVGISSYQAASAQLLAQVGLPAPVITEMKHIQLGENALEMRRLLKQGEIYHLKVADTGIFSPVLCGHLLRAGLEYATLLPMHLESGQVRGGLVFFSPTEFLEAADARIRSGCDLAAIAIERQRLLDSLEHQALHDPLTGLPNRALYKAHLEHAMATALRNQSSFALIQLDLNFFKSLNDTYGHTYGDKVLCRVAQTLLQAVRASDLVARLGGDEFCIVALDIKTHEEAQHFCHKLEQTLASIDLESGESVSAAIGYAIFPSDADQADSLYSHADRAMYHEKKLAR